jgi:hypothetical protein
VCDLHRQIHELHEAKSSTEEVIRSKENIVNFIEALEALQFPTSGIFSCADVESTGWEDRCCLRQACLHPSRARMHGTWGDW